MTKKIVAVFDCSRDYVDHFLGYVNRKGPKGIEWIGFTEPQALEKHLEGNTVDLLLFSMEDVLCTEENEKKETEYAKFLSHERVRQFAYLGERRNSKSTLTHIDKYRSMGALLQDVLALFGKAPGQVEEEAAAADGSAELIGIYSPSAEHNAVEASLRVAESMSGRKRVLLLDLERFSVLPNLAKAASDGGLSEVIYFYKANPGGLRECLRQQVCRFRSLDFLYAPEHFEDLNEIAEAEWPVFLQTLAAAGDYHSVVIHLAEAFRKPEALLSACRKVYLPSRKTSEAKYKLRCFKNILEQPENEGILEKAAVIDMEEWEWN